MDLRECKDGVSRHPWELSRSRFFCDLVSGIAPDVPANVLDVGAGDGWLAEELLPVLADGSTVSCWDINYTDEDLEQVASEGSVRRIRELDDQSYDVVLMLDVLEHVKDDDGMLRSAIIPRLRPGTFVIVSVPVHPVLFTHHDTALAHERRYRVREIQALLRSHFLVLQEGSLFTSLLAPRALQRGLELVGVTSKAEGVGAWSGGPALTRAVTRLLELDNRLNARMASWPVKLPGLSYWAIAGLPMTSGRP